MSQDGFDYDLHEPETTAAVPATRRRPSSLWIVALVVLASAGLLYLAMRGRPQAPLPQPDSSRSTTGAVAEPRALGPEPFTITLPRLDDSDAAVRSLVGRFSSDRTLATWLSSSGLIRSFTLSVANIAEGTTPAAPLRLFRLSRPFRTTQRGGNLYIDTRNYDRYTPFAAAIASIDAANGARIYVTFKPLMQEAYRDLGYPDTPFDRTFERAIVHLLGVPALTDPVRVEPKGIGYAFADRAVEALSRAQKQVLRSGPENTRRIQDALRNLALALGIPSQRLPS